MAPYRHHVNTYHRAKRARKVRRLAVTTMVVGILISTVIGVDWVLQRIKSSTAVVSESTVTAVQSAQLSVLRTGYFQFQAPSEWVLLNNDLNNGKYTYVKKDRTLITHMLVVYVDRAKEFANTDHRLTRVMPVDLGEEHQFTNIGGISDHCAKSWPPELKKNPTEITHADVKFKCVPDSEEFNVLIGLRKAGADLKFKSTNSETGETTEHVINMVYSDLTATPSNGDLQDIIASFVVL